MLLGDNTNCGLAKSHTGLVCPHCELPMIDHGPGGECRKKKVSRRFFLGFLGSAAAVAAATSIQNFSVIEQQADSAIVQAVPKVWRGSAIRIAVSGEKAPSIDQLIFESDHISRREKRQVVAIKDGVVVHFVEPLKG